MQVVLHVEVERAVAVRVEERARLAPAGIAIRTVDRLERAVAAVAVQHVDAEVRHVEILVAVGVVVGGAAALAVGRVADAGRIGLVLERAVAAIAVEAIADGG